jgi:hypothetical protein
MLRLRRRPLLASACLLLLTGLLLSFTVLLSSEDAPAAPEAEQKPAAKIVKEIRGKRNSYATTYLLATATTAPSSPRLPSTTEMRRGASSRSI